MSSQRESVTVLEECIDLQKRKSKDYQNPNSNIKQAMHYRRGVSTIHDMVQQKLYRAQSLLEPLENGDVSAPNFESLEDTYKDAINYLSFAVSYIRGKMEGQDPSRDMLNRAHPNGGLAKSEVFTNPDSHSETLVLTERVVGEPLIPRFTDRGGEVLAALSNTYRESVAHVGPIVVPEDEKDIPADTYLIENDPVVRTYKKVTDVGDRIEETFDPTVKSESER